jgi:hypothetical protein
MTEGWLWTGQYPEAQRILDHGNNQSMELDENLINAHWTKDVNGKPQFFIINEAIISKLCILGEECEPCFEGAQITKVQFSFEEGFKETLFSMMKELKEMLNEGGTPMFTTYAVEIGDSLWNAIYDYVVDHYPAEDCECCPKYRIEGIYEEGDQKFAILHDYHTDAYYRMNFSIGEEGYTFEAELIAVEKEFVPVTDTPQFDPAAYAAYVASKKPEEEEEEKEVCPKCGKPLDECECDEEGKKDKYVLEEIQEYMELMNQYNAVVATNKTLQDEIDSLTSAKASLESQIEELAQFKLSIERKEKEMLINDTFYMLPEEDKEDVIKNIDIYSLDDIEAKLSVLCVRRKISFNEETPPAPTAFHLDSTITQDDSIPAWIKAVLEKQKTM